MPRKNEAWGIEVGSQAIKAMKLARHGSTVHLEDFEVIPFKQILTTPDINVEEAIRVNLDMLSQKHELDKSQVVVSVPGHMAFARFAKLPPVDPSKVQSIVAYEAQQQIPFPIEQVEWDYQVFEEEDAPDVEVGIFAITKERVAQFLSNYRAVDLRVDALTLSPVAVYNAFAYEEKEGNPEDGTVYLDIGTVSTDIIIVESGGIWLRTLPLGGNHFTEALMKQFKISFARAEKLKKEASTSKYAKQIFQAMRGVFHDLVQEVQRSLGFYQSKNRDSELNKVVGVGSTWKLPGLQKYLKQHLQMDVIRPDGFSRLAVDGKRAAEFSSEAMTMATAYGLALQGLGLDAVSANVLPQMILRQRMWKAKQPWIGAAAACIAVGAGVAAVTHYVKASSYDSAAETGLAKVDGAIAKARSFSNELQAEIGQDPRPEIENYRRAFDYRDLMPKLTADLNAALQSIDTQPELRTGDPDQIITIPRDQRRQVWLEDVQIDFIPMANSETMPTDLTGMAAAGQVFFVEAAAEGEVGAAPRLRLKIIGRSPLPEREAVNLIETPFIQWFRDNAQQADRPYEYVVGRRFLSRRWQAGAPLQRTGTLLGGSGGGSGFNPGSGFSGGGRPGQAGGRSGGFGGLQGPGGLPPSGGGFDPSGPGRPGGLSGPGGGSGLGAGFPGIGENGGDTEVVVPSITTDGGQRHELGSNGWAMAALLPQRPLSNENSTNDTMFEVTFDLLLVPPTEARKTMTPGGRTLPSDDEQPEPSAGAPTPDGASTVASTTQEELSQ